MEIYLGQRLRRSLRLLCTRRSPRQHVVSASVRFGSIYMTPRHLQTLRKV